MRDLFVSAVIFGLIPFILVNPVVGVLTWCWLGFMNPHKLCWGFAQTFPFAQTVAIATLVSLMAWKEPKRIPWTRETKTLLVFTLWMFVTTFFALNPEGAWEQWNKVWKIMLMTYVTMMVMNTPKRIHMLLWVTALSLGFYGVKGGIFTLVTGGQFIVLGPEKTFIGVRGGIALALNMTIPLMRYLQLTTPQKWIRVGLGAAMALTGLAVIGTHSRGGFLGALAMSFFLIMKTRRKFFYTLLLAATAYGILSFMPSFWAERMHTIETYEEDGSAMGRINAWLFAFNLAKDRPIGGGFECFRGWLFDRYAPNPNDVHDAHSIFFEVLGEHGFIGLGLYLALILMTWRSAGWIRKNAGGDSRTQWLADAASMIQVSLVGYMVGGSFLGLAYFDLFYHLVGIIVLCRVLLERHKAGEDMAIQDYRFF
ncbi:probable O-glycosylation ligase, exosortase A-associated [Desulfacinum infernum DSM 9756]|uniref:Probable O-glycosylation ligase, exosortase A-associated n=1 Tax=Desulfacinum infernum DSM 9756 TaxID=1121391 RepID=A0A1M5HY95_9BACT|nr:putative O-glycosylation ligase, exosortase A system-associated [Desulfacinum infernum]SHG20935.1 probable O-glycosylation ligase, exosortase A-associated [Desulfacinum infernum DSM 9756]